MKFNETRKTVDCCFSQGHDNVDLLQVRNVLPAQGVEPPKIRLRQEHLNAAQCNLDIFRCTLTKIPETNALLQKSRLPLGVLIHPFKDLTVNPETNYTDKYER